MKIKIIDNTLSAQGNFELAACMLMVDDAYTFVTGHFKGRPEPDPDTVGVLLIQYIQQTDKLFLDRLYTGSCVESSLRSYVSRIKQGQNLAGLKHAIGKVSRPSWFLPAEYNKKLMTLAYHVLQRAGCATTRQLKILGTPPRVEARETLHASFKH